MHIDLDTLTVEDVEEMILQGDDGEIFDAINDEVDGGRECDNKGRLACTRAKNHLGIHIAQGVSGICGAWPRTDDQKTMVLLWELGLCRKNVDKATGLLWEVYRGASSGITPRLLGRIKNFLSVDEGI